MTTERWNLAKAIVGDAAEVSSPTARAALVAERCGEDVELRREVESLLDQTTGALERAAQYATETFRRDLTSFSAGRRLGPWAIVREIGRGGMGAVYLAERADGAFTRHVAIKVLKRGLDTEEIVERFLGERQILARLDHPGIVRVVDAGTTDDGLPYLVMDYVEGMPITQYAREHELSVDERLRLFRDVCTAVTYAHQNLIVHRDLKPSNILITREGEVKLLDFGIAKLLEPDAAAYPVTITMLRVMTPEYASPEQVQGNPVTTVSDVYSLGVVLYELLTGERPYRLKTRRADEVSKAICEQEPERPSTVVANRESRFENQDSCNSRFTIPDSRSLRGDLDNIVLKALRKEPPRRYSSVNQLSEDIRRHLEGLPVRARKDTVGYRSAKFVRRHKVGVAAVAIIALVLLAGMIATIFEWQNARAERRKAEARFEIVRKSSRTMFSEIQNALANLPGSVDARRLLLQRATEQLDALESGAGDDSRLQVDLADAYQEIGSLPDKSLAERTELFHKAIALDQNVLAKEPKNIGARENLAMSNINLADFARARGNNDEALVHNREAIALLESVAHDEPAKIEHKKTLWDASYNTALTFTQLGRAAEALEVSKRIYPLALELQEKDSADKSEHKFRRPYLSLALAANGLTYLGRYDEAISKIRMAMTALTETRQRFPLGTYERQDESVFYYRLAIALEGKGHRDEAIAAMKTAEGLAETLTTDDPKNLSYRSNAAMANAEFATLLLRANKRTESINYFRRAIDLYEGILAADPQRTQAKADLEYAYAGLGYALAATGDIPQGLADEQKALSFYNKFEPANNSNVVLLRNCAETLDWAGETCLLSKSKESASEGKQLLQRSLSIWRLMRERGTLSKADAGKPDETARRIADIPAS
jgi:eukaryotic-like serine/threonine-protein kinase